MHMIAPNRNRPRIKKPPATPSEKRMCCTLYAREGYSVEEIARLVGRSQKSISATLKESGANVTRYRSKRT